MFKTDYKNTLKEELYNHRNKINELIDRIGDKETITDIYNKLDNITVILDYEVGEFENYASCINRLVREGKTVKLLNREYDLIEPIILVSNSTILMGDKTKLNRKHSGIMIYGEYDVNTTEYNGVENIYIEGGILNQASFEGETNMTAFCHASNITFNNVTFLDCCNVHSIDLQGCKNVYINNCKFLGYKSIGKDKFREQVQIDMAIPSAMGLGDNDNFPNNSPLFDGTRCQNIHIMGCLFDKSENYPPAHNCIGTHSHGEKSKKGIGRSSNIFIKDNVFKGNGLIYTTTEDGQLNRRSGKCIRLLQYDNVFIENNVFTNFAKAISIECLTYVWTIDYNKIYDKEFLDTQILGNTNIFIRGNKIECCSFDSSTDYDYTWNGISVMSSLDYINHKNIFIQNNIITNDKTLENKSIGIEFTDNCIIRDNILTGGHCGIYVNARNGKNVLTGENLYSDLDKNVDYDGGTTNNNGHGLLMNIDGGSTPYLIYIPQSQTNDILRMKEQSTGKTIDFVTKDTLDIILRKYNLIE